MKKLAAWSLALLTLAQPALAFAAEGEGPSTKDLAITTDTVWVLFCAFLVFFMHAGFSLLESGLVRKKNVVNVLAKNFIVVAASSLVFYAVGFAFMFGNGGSIVGTTGFFVPNDASLFDALSWTNVPVTVKFFFQMVFAATAATIVSGAVAERIHYVAFIIFSLVMGAVIYPIAGHWVWGGGFLAKAGFLDFAGSTVVHSVGGWAALVGVWMLGPRRGKYDKHGHIKPIPGHNMTSAALGTFILWLGWFGFNPGSTMAANPQAIGHIVLTTNLAAATGALVTTGYTWLRTGKPDLGLTLNGALAGLVAITAPCAFVGGPASIAIGALASVLVVEGVMFFDRVKLDDPVGATSVHLLCGVFGTIALGLFADPKIAKEIAGADLQSAGLLLGGGAAQLVAQLEGVGAVALFTLVSSVVVWGALKATMGIRVSEEDEHVGLDITEMGMEAYPDEMVRGFRLEGAEEAPPSTASKLKEAHEAG
ncbi:MAG: ammonium transporter [Myxococcales bacterium]|nr:ammonium transporter [Myxococcales bacterium]MCB9576068.1 ammonium transporter [Polyangiaceae bacterium]